MPAALKRNHLLRHHFYCITFVCDMGPVFKIANKTIYRDLHNRSLLSGRAQCRGNCHSFCLTTILLFFFHHNPVFSKLHPQTVNLQLQNIKKKKNTNEDRTRLQVVTPAAGVKVLQPSTTTTPYTLCLVQECTQWTGKNVAT